MTQATRLQFSDTPGTLSQYARALMAKGSKQKEPQLPQLEALQTGVKASSAKVAAYAEVCGFDKTSPVLPLTYPHILAFPLHMELMLHKSFPLALMGLVHIRNRITQHRAIGVTEKLDIRCFIAGSERTDKGLEFDIKAEVTVAGELVWESVSTNLARIGGGAKKAATNKARPALPTFDMAERWMLSTDLGRRYARVSGDSNPIHLFALSAKLFGFKSHIAHGMWSKARTAAALQKKLGVEACTIEAEFKLPVFLPTTVELNYTSDNSAINFDLRDIKGEKVHMKGALQALK